MTDYSLQIVAFDEARRFGHRWLGPEHALLAIARRHPDDPAGRALAAVGLHPETIKWTSPERAVASLEDGNPIRPNPAWYQLLGRSQGFAAAMGALEPGPTHFLLGILWDPRGWVLLERQGVSRESLLVAMVQQEIRVPETPLPEIDRFTPTQRAEFPRTLLDEVVALLLANYSPVAGARFRFYNDDNRAWVDAEEDIDLERHVEIASNKGTEEQ